MEFQIPVVVTSQGIQRQSKKMTKLPFTSYPCYGLSIVSQGHKVYKMSIMRKPTPGLQLGPT